MEIVVLDDTTIKYSSITIMVTPLYSIVVSSSIIKMTLYYYRVQWCDDTTVEYSSDYHNGDTTNHGDTL